jgi:two-component system sensor histidine kinase BaeS
MAPMRVGLRKKLIIAMLTASVVATIAMGIASQLGFQRGFVAFLNDQSLARFESLVPKVAALYEHGNSWDYLRANPREWFDVIGIPGGGPTTIPKADAPFTVANVDVTGTGLRITLFDEQHQFLIGYPNVMPDTSTSSAVSREITSRGRTVGWMTLSPVEQLSNLAETRFERNQRTLTFAIGLLAIAAATLIALWLSNAFIRPIRRIADTTNKLAAGDYAARVATGPQDEIGQLGRDVNHLALALERTESMRRHYMADISHELRTPLAVLRAELEALYDGVRTTSRESLASLLSEVTTLSKLVNDVHELAIADVGALSYRKDKVDAREILQSCVAAFHERFEQQHLKTLLEPATEPLPVLGDESRLQQLFNNLLENAARYTDAGGTISIACRHDSINVHVRLEDSAPGVTDELLPHLFERFFRADASRSRKTGGSGLGMAICRSIVEAHGGQIRADHSNLGGLRIEITLPLIVT